MKLDLEVMDPVQFIDGKWWDDFAAEQKDIVERRWIAVRVSDLSGRVWVRLGVKDGSAVLTGLLLDMDRPLSAEDLRRFPLGGVRDFAAARADGAMWSAAGRGLLPHDEALHTFPIPTKAAPAQRPGKRAPATAELLGQVADVWKAAKISHPRSPMKRTAEQLGYSIPQMRRIVRKAEAAGFIKTTETEE